MRIAIVKRFATYALILHGFDHVGASRRNPKNSTCFYRTLRILTLPKFIATSKPMKKKPRKVASQAPRLGTPKRARVHATKVVNTGTHSILTHAQRRSSVSSEVVQKDNRTPYIYSPPHYDGTR